MKNRKNGPIIVKLESPFDKAQLLKSIAKFRRTNNNTFCLSNAGFSSDRPIYVNECLTKSNHDIFVAAYKLKNQKQLVSVFTMRGTVHIKKLADDIPIAVHSLQKLTELFFRSAETQNPNYNNNNNNLPADDPSQQENSK